MKHNKIQYAFLLIDFQMPGIIKNIQDKIDKDDIYYGEEGEEDNGWEYGLEKESHVTLCPCLDLTVSAKDLKPYLHPLKDYKCVFKNISVFENEKYDVLKADVYCPNMVKTNKEIGKDFTYNTEFKDYHPHMTIAYLKKGTAGKYVQEMPSKIEEYTPRMFKFSTADEKGNDLSVYFKI